MKKAVKKKVKKEKKILQRKLKVVYDSRKEGVNSELDAKIAVAVRKFGWFPEGSGYDLKTGKRDLSFYKRIKK
jgi:hypothetical protein